MLFTCRKSSCVLGTLLTKMHLNDVLQCTLAFQTVINSEINYVCVMQNIIIGCYSLTLQSRNHWK